MRQYTTHDQTAKLIELGFEKPKSVLLYAQSVDCDNNYGWNGEVKQNGNYSIGELIEILPEFSNIYDLTNMHTMKRCWYVGHVSTLNVGADELIDALYDMIVKLKAEGVI